MSHVICELCRLLRETWSPASTTLQSGREARMSLCCGKRRVLPRGLIVCCSITRGCSSLWAKATKMEKFVRRRKGRHFGLFNRWSPPFRFSEDRPRCMLSRLRVRRTLQLTDPSDGSNCNQIPSDEPSLPRHVNSWSQKRPPVSSITSLEAYDTKSHRLYTDFRTTQTPPVSLQKPAVLTT